MAHNVSDHDQKYDRQLRCVTNGGFLNGFFNQLKQRLTCVLGSFLAFGELMVKQSLKRPTFACLELVQRAQRPSKIWSCLVRKSFTYYGSLRLMMVMILLLREVSYWCCTNFGYICRSGSLHARR